MSWPKNIPKFVWYEGDKWQVVAAPKPNRAQQFLLIQRETNEVEQTGESTITMICIDPGDEVCYPDTPTVRKAMSELREALNKAEATCVMIEGNLEHLWRGMF